MSATNISPAPRRRSQGGKIDKVSQVASKTKNSLLPEIVETKKPWSPAQRIGFLRSLHRDQLSKTQGFEIALLRNALEMTNEEKNGIPIEELQDALKNLKAAHNTLSRVLAAANESANQIIS